MSTITKEFTKEQLISAANARMEFAEMMMAKDLLPLQIRNWSIELELARIALASLEAEAVADVVAWSSPNEERTCDIRMRRHDIKPGSLYTAPPAPEFYKIGDATMRHIFTPTGITDVSDMQAVFDQIETVLAGMWQPAPVSVPDAMDGQGGVCCEVSYADGWNSCRAAMLQGAEPVTTANKLPEGWVACSERMPEADGNYWGWWSESKRQGPAWFIKSELQAQFQSSEITHWMPLPAAPQQGDSF